MNLVIIYQYWNFQSLAIVPQRFLQANWSGIKYNSPDLHGNSACAAWRITLEPTILPLCNNLRIPQFMQVISTTSQQTLGNNLEIGRLREGVPSEAFR